jgi:hypothetical protein
MIIENFQVELLVRDNAVQWTLLEIVMQSPLSCRIRHSKANELEAFGASVTSVAGRISVVFT